MTPARNTGSGRDIRALTRFLVAILPILPILHRVSGNSRTARDVVKVALEVFDRG
ncbi:MAG: hypothetical protein ACFCBW_07205 [Candidatus Competibacterales bacterium]